MGNCLISHVKKAEKSSFQFSSSSSGISKYTSRDVISSTTSQSMSSVSTRADGSNSSNLTSEGQSLPSDNLRVFNFNLLKSATRNFRPGRIGWEGGFGCVFKGWIDEQGIMAAKPGMGMVIAVKKLNHDSSQGHNEWLAEVNYLGQLHHPNLVKLLGYCIEDDHRLLVYEFLSKGSLENQLFTRDSNNQSLSWAIRMKVAIGAAKGLSFLHSKEKQAIYRDFRTINILLDSHYNAKLSDIGLAKDGPTGDKTHVSTRIMGTHGYAAPEYVATGHLTTKSDVYSYGVVLLEILSGRRALEKNRPNEAKFRPDMDDVLETLEELQTINTPRNSQNEQSGKKKSIADVNKHANAQHKNIKDSSSGYPRPGAAPLC